MLTLRDLNLGPLKLLSGAIRTELPGVSDRMLYKLSYMVLAIKWSDLQISHPYVITLFFLTAKSGSNLDPF